MSDPVPDPYATPQTHRFQRPIDDMAGPLPPSKMGFYSVVLAIIAGTLFMVGLLGAAFWAARLPEEPPEDSLVYGLAGLGMLAAIPLALTGLILGVVGLFRPTPRRTWAVIGTIMNTLVLLSLGGILAIAIMTDGW